MSEAFTLYAKYNSIPNTKGGVDILVAWQAKYFKNSPYK